MKIELSDRFMNEDKMYTYIENFAIAKQMNQTIKALPFAREKHEGQYRRGIGKIPYIYHPLAVACHALALGFENDSLIATALLHDVCEDCGVTAEELPVNDETKQAVSLLTKNSNTALETYFYDISQNVTATIVKLLDRCNNVSGMSAGFDKEKLVRYIEETEKYFYPLLQYAEEKYPQYSNQLILIKYHISSVVESIKHQL